MQLSLAMLAKKAIESALKNDWATAIDCNNKILEKDPKNTDAKTRLGRAYIQTKEFNKAKKIFKDVLKTDPINQVALKNLEQANKKRVEHKQISSIDSKSLLKEPGTTTEASVEIEVKGMTSNDFSMGEPLILRIKKKTAEVVKVKKDEKIVVGTLSNPDLVQKLNISEERAGETKACFLRGKDKSIVIMIKSNVPVFRSEKQDVRPYIKKGSLDEPELEIEESEPVVDEG